MSPKTELAMKKAQRRGSMQPSGMEYLWTSEGWLYLAVILDLYSRRVIDWAVSNRMKRNLAIRALDMAVALRKPAMRP